MLGKIFKLKAHEIAPVAVGRGGCLATDRIVVDGARVGYMYRETPIRADDSGWRFFAGDEDDTYMTNTERHGVYDINTLVNYDPDILPLLDAVEGSRFERDGSGAFKKIAADE
jgi:hypothetical protein